MPVTLPTLQRGNSSHTLQRQKISQPPRIINTAGSIMVLSYAVFRKDPVLFIGQLFGVVVYSRNIVLGLRHRPCR